MEFDGAVLVKVGSNTIFVESVLLIPSRFGRDRVQVEIVAGGARALVDPLIQRLGQIGGRLHAVVAEDVQLAADVEADALGARRVGQAR